MKPLKQIALSTILAGMFLSAGAFAKSDVIPQPHTAATKVTVIHKTSALPRIILIKSCVRVKCVEA